MKPKSIMTTAALALSTQATATPTSCSTVSQVTLTFYGWPDNDPPSAEIAYDCGRGNKAGGNGTYDNPLTAASAPGEFDKCEIAYLPYIQRYVRIEDTCATCSMLPFPLHANKAATNWNKKQHHIDIWIESIESDDGGKVMDCENTLTPKHGIRVIRNPGEKLRVVGMSPGSAYGGRYI
ncbi:uncharacterized protein ASPGLDRAFT_147568 [Aspergillus glaucus CBS 516.65]|uniref:RlpA-like protein double-psi beta-barrel domain-containing protein n=1 Tax=Aspergillus glaucus CBS 516.65 TaxID=1160497 RepID=A0A1L9VLZ5_ASPGL|nr:hypothetical protein ASPGLDRAFT_147568 [Aspergillus glaucus CBS 516.65]OJJ84958.1 hypothetical protein ASPGLDRAFT_147568 [Aspergillus glaucus CBS 516.65]